MRWRAGTGARWEAVVGYSRVVRVGRQVRVTGTIALGAEGQPVDGDAETQTRRVLTIVAEALSRVGATVDDVVGSRIYVTDIAADWEAVGRVHGEVFGSVRPTTTMVEVAALIEPWCRVEIEVEAVLGGGRPREAPDVAIGAGRPEDVAGLLDATRLAAADPEASIWVARADGDVVGTASTVRVGDAVLLRSCAVAEAWRGRGVGALLVDVALLRAGSGWAYLATESAAGFFERLGFARIEQLPPPIAERLPHACGDATPMRREP